LVKPGDGGGVEQAKQLAPQGAIDSHAHVFTRSLPRIATPRYIPHRDASADEYLALLDCHGLAGGILVQPSFLGTDARHLLDVLAGVPDRFRGIAVVERDAPAALLHRLEEKRVVGIRINLMGTKHESLEPFVSAALLAELRRRNWLLEVQAEGPRWIKLMPELARSGARVVIDHFGRPSPALGVDCPGFHAILEAGRDVDLHVKLSGPYRFGTHHAAACARALLAALGAERLLWGSDWPWTQFPEITDYTATLAALATWIPDAALRRQILVDNPRALYGFR
jgi:predicted TIM-barrel fold metal-dependent hydrolase